MRFSLVFENSGDEILVDSVNQELLEYYVDQMDQRGLYKFLADPSTGEQILSSINQLHSDIVSLNEIPIREILGQDLQTYDTLDYLDQWTLNKMHADWACSQSQKYNVAGQLKLHRSDITRKLHDMLPDDLQFPTVANVLNKLGINELYSELNTGIHQIEDQIREIRFQCNNYKMLCFDNPFSKKYVTNDICNFRLGANHLGRFFCQKYLNFDMKLQADDENTYNEFIGIVEIIFRPPETIPYSKEYTAWCRSHNREPTGTYLNFGNIVDLVDKLTMYRQIIVRNMLSNNSFSIHLKRG